MKKFSVRVVLIISVLFIALGNANVSIAQERDTTNKLPEEELSSLDTFIARQTPRNEAGKILGTLQLGGVTGMLFGPLIGGAMADLFG
ncbi:hypothetical protein UZ47_08085, partial [Listeria monocytogenes]